MEMCDDPKAGSECNITCFTESHRMKTAFYRNDVEVGVCEACTQNTSDTCCKSLYSEHYTLRQDVESSMTQLIIHHLDIVRDFGKWTCVYGDLTRLSTQLNVYGIQIFFKIKGCHYNVIKSTIHVVRK